MDYNYIDMHCDTLMSALRGKKETVEYLPGAMADVRRLRRSGAEAQFFAMFLQQEQLPGVSEEADAGRLYDKLLLMYEIYRNTLKVCSQYLAPARSYEDLVKNRRAGKLSAFLTIENGCPVNGKMENLKQFHDMGVGLITLTWNDANCFGFPHSQNAAEMAKGLTDFGKEAISYMNALGIIVDVSHLSDQGFYDVAELSEKPFVASHSNCRMLCPSSRNLTDEMIRVLAVQGGVAGINFEPTFLNENTEDKLSRIERMCDHIEHFVKVGGTDCVGIGTDFDGISGNFEIADCTQMYLLFDALERRGFSGDLIDKIAFKNVARVIRESMA